MRRLANLRSLFFSLSFFFSVFNAIDSSRSAYARLIFVCVCACFFATMLFLCCEPLL